ncbi:hypothetical protein [Streptomyces sp. NPDC002088]|uniref:hypothetical protein n=1 Tax=Streptomyces sp. NPDC002088 TaxID=3154665 RepID=UPI0033332BEE
MRQAFTASDGPAERLWGMVFKFSRWHLENAKLGRVVEYEFAALTDEDRAEVLVLRRQTQAVVVDAIRDGARRGTFRLDDVEGTARALLSLFIDPVHWFFPDRHDLAPQARAQAARRARPWRCDGSACSEALRQKGAGSRSPR